MTSDALKGIGIGIALSIFSQITGSMTLISYAVPIFRKIGTSLDPFTSSIILAVALVLGASASTYLADKLGRKLLNVSKFLIQFVCFLAPKSITQAYILYPIVIIFVRCCDWTIRYFAISLFELEWLWFIGVRIGARFRFIIRDLRNSGRHCGPIICLQYWVFAAKGL